jgi:hypothetical protein
MTSIRPPRIATWLLEHLTCGADNEAVLGDLAERYQKGETRAWYWKQALIVIVLTGVRGPVLVGAVMGIVTCGFSVAGNIARGDIHNLTPFPNVSTFLVAPLITFIVVRYWRKHGFTVEEVRGGLRRTAVAYGIVFTLMTLAYAILWFSWDDGTFRGLPGFTEWFPILGFGAILLFPLMVLKVWLFGYLAARLPVRGIAK